MINEKEVRHLLKVEKWPEEYFDSELIDISETIIYELYELKHDSSYLRDRDYQQTKKNELKFLEGLAYIFRYNKEVALEVCKKTKRFYKSLEDVKKAIDNRIFDLKVQKIKAEAEAKKYQKKTFEALCIPIEKKFKITIDRDITVTKFIEWENALKEE